MPGVIDVDEEGFAFEPTPDDLAMAIGLRPDPDTDREPLDELADAMLVWAEGPSVDRLASTAVEAIWSVDLETAIADGLRRVAGDGEEWRAAAAQALVELMREPKRSAIGRAVVERLAMDLGYLDLPAFFCLCCIDESLRMSATAAKRALALQCAPVAKRAAAVGDAELARAMSAAGLGSAIDELGRAARRRAVRARLGRLGTLGRDSVPALACELRTIAAEPLPERPHDDDVWVAVGTALLARRARPELN
jgi:hypothetical protein